MVTFRRWLKKAQTPVNEEPKDDSYNKLSSAWENATPEAQDKFVGEYKNDLSELLGAVKQMLHWYTKDPIKGYRL